MIMKICARCGHPTVYPARFCSLCAPIVQEERERSEAEHKAKAMSKYNRQRDPKFSQFYKSRAWKMLASRFMQDHAFRCDDCGGLAVEVHHITPIQTPEGWERRFDVNNLCCLCVDCHNKRHGRFIRHADRRDRGRRGS